MGATTGRDVKVPNDNGKPVVHYYVGIVENGVLVAVMPHTRTHIREQAEQSVEKRGQPTMLENLNRHWVLVEGTETFEVV